MIEQITSIIGQIVVVGGGAAAIAFALLKWFGQKWFESKFAASLEQFKREQSEILEQSRYQLNTRFNRVTKIHEKEFEVLPQAWHLLQDAYGHFMIIVKPYQEWPDLNRYSAEQVESFLESCELKESQKAVLRQKEDKLLYYQVEAYWIRLDIARGHFHEFRKFLRYNKIFLSGDIFDLFRRIEEVMIEIQVALEEPDNKDHPWRGTIKTYKILTETVNKLLEEVEGAVQKRLHFEQT